MKRLVIALTFALALVMAIGAVAYAGVGNGAPSGPHYNLNIIGVPKDKTGDYDSGNRIFVPLDTSGNINGKIQILLEEGPFGVIDGNATDDGVAKFSLPKPDTYDPILQTSTGISSYSVYARALGKPNGSASMTTCFTDSLGTWCSTGYTLNLDRKTGKSSFTNVTKNLLYVYADYDSDLTVERVPLFGLEDAEFFWEYVNNGLKLAQLRFYEIPTNVN